MCQSITDEEGARHVNGAEFDLWVGSAGNLELKRVCSRMHMSGYATRVSSRSNPLFSIGIFIISLGRCRGLEPGIDEGQPADLLALRSTGRTTDQEAPESWVSLFRLLRGLEAPLSDLDFGVQCVGVPLMECHWDLMVNSRSGVEKLDQRSVAGPDNPNIGAPKFATMGEVRMGVPNWLVANTSPMPPPRSVSKESGIKGGLLRKGFAAHAHGRLEGCRLGAGKLVAYPHGSLVLGVRWT